VALFAKSAYQGRPNVLIRDDARGHSASRRRDEDALGPEYVGRVGEAR
jgi:hypothetical protein